MAGLKTKAKPEEKIEDLIYQFPWLLDDRFVIPNIAGARRSGRQVNVGINGYGRYIDLLFKDTRDNRPVIVELKAENLKREHVAQILEYKSLIISLDEEKSIVWKNEFGRNYLSPKMILIGPNVPEEVEISANLAGIDVRVLKGMKEFNFSKNIKDINNRLKEWEAFKKSGNETLSKRDEWISIIFKQVNDLIEEYDSKDLATCNKLCKTTYKTSYCEDTLFPFINIPIIYKDDHMLGLYEYADEFAPFSDKHIYCDFWVCERILENDDIDSGSSEKIKSEIIRYFEKREYRYKIYDAEDYWHPFVLINRKILANERDFKDLLKRLISDGIKLSEKYTEYLT